MSNTSDIRKDNLKLSTLVQETTVSTVKENYRRFTSAVGFIYPFVVSNKSLGWMMYKNTG